MVNTPSIHYLICIRFNFTDITLSERIKEHITAAIKLSLIILCLFTSSLAFGQYNWTLSKNKDGIKVYESYVKNASFKSIKVECTLQGTYLKLMNILDDINHHPDWVYSNKTAYIVKRISPDEYYYYSETSMPWPISNRDALVHVKMIVDSLTHSLTVTEISEPDYVPEKSGIVRIPKSFVSWNVTMPTDNTVRIVYILNADPGGSIPAWLANIFLDKGPYESFKKLGTLLKQ